MLESITSDSFLLIPYILVNLYPTKETEIGKNSINLNSFTTIKYTILIVTSTKLILIATTIITSKLYTYNKIAPTNELNILDSIIYKRGKKISLKKTFF